jgi:N utilization substance protein B
MASNRHLGRIIALQTLYEEEFRREASDASLDVDAVLRRNIKRYEALVDDLDFIHQLVHGVLGKEKDLDATLQPIAPEWPIDQIARMDRVVLRIGLYELEQTEGAPPKVVINEAIELAKAFGSENSSKFVNGVLGTALRNLTGETDATKAPKPKTTKPKPTAKLSAKPVESTETNPRLQRFCKQAQTNYR